MTDEPPDVREMLAGMAADAAQMTPDEADTIAVVMITPLLPRMSVRGRRHLAAMLRGQGRRG